MRYRMLALSALLLGASIGYAADRPADSVFLLPKSDLNKLQAGGDVKLYQDVETTLVFQIKDKLAKKRLKVDLVESEREAAADPQRYLLQVKLDKVDIGAQGPLGQIATVKVSYRFQDRDRTDIIHRYYEETSYSKWQNCVKKISGMIAKDVDRALSKISKGKPAEKPPRVKETSAAAPSSVKEAPTGTAEQVQETPAVPPGVTTSDPGKESAPVEAASPANKTVQVKQAPVEESVESRLERLEKLRAKGLISRKEYEKKRKEILKEL